MRILFIGDIFGRSGREAIRDHLPSLKNKLKPDVIIANGDNAAHGRGITEKICKELFEQGVDCITSGDHVWDQREIITYITREKNYIRPRNYKSGTPGSGFWEKTLNSGEVIKVLHLQGRVFMKPNVDDPFEAATLFCEKHPRGNNVSVFVDFHAEATSEKMAMGHHVNGKVSVIVGSHTHVPTADCMILKDATGYQTDAGMSGDYDSIIGAQAGNALDRFVKQMPRNLAPADGEGTLCGTFVETNPDSGKCTFIAPVKIGGSQFQNDIPNITV